MVNVASHGRENRCDSFHGNWLDLGDSTISNIKTSQRIVPLYCYTLDDDRRDCQVTALKLHAIVAMSRLARDFRPG